MYEKELKAIKRADRYRERVISDENLIDLASNDYLGFAEERELFNRAVERVSSYKRYRLSIDQVMINPKTCKYCTAIFIL